jgi:ribosomal protein L12E/L44/L45/RPP1/RPP2
MSGPPSLVYAGFEGGESMSQKNLEQARCKFLLDKLTGKLPEELKAKFLEPIPGSASDAGSDAGSRAGSAIKDRGVSKKEDDEADEKAEGDKKKPQQWSELDKFIELLLDSKSDEETVFLYLNQNENNDPYDLRVTTYKEIL